jgi:hypothetical protein
MQVVLQIVQMPTHLVLENGEALLLLENLLALRAPKAAKCYNTYCNTVGDKVEAWCLLARSSELTAGSTYMC